MRRKPFVLVAPNAFKGSLSAPEAARAMAAALRRARPGLRVRLLPVADGGDGLIEALRAALGGRLVAAPARGPLGGRRRAEYLWLASRRTAVIETARACGLALLPAGRRRPLAAGSEGAGDLCADAVRRGARTLIVGLGGTAASDGGAGWARALGARLLDPKGRAIPSGARGLLSLDRIDREPLRKALSGVRIIGLADVDNPLLGPRGSARVFGPQKGASPAQVRIIERALSRWASALGGGARGLAMRRGAGACGGMGLGLLSLGGARLEPGADWVLARLGAHRALRGASLVLTGEGRLDRTSLGGKAPAALARLARAAGVPAAAACGSVEAAALPALRRAGFSRAAGFAQAGARGRGDCLRRAAFWAGRAAVLAAEGLLAAALAAPPAAKAAEPSPEFAALDAEYFSREKPGVLARHLMALDAAAAARPGDAETLWRRCRARVRAGEAEGTRAGKLAAYEAARRDGEAAVAGLPGHAEAHFWLGVALGRWGQAKGIMKALFLIKPIRREMERALALDPAHGGAHHVLGEMLWEIPGFAGGDKKRALAEFEAAVRLSPDHTANHVPLARAYLHFGRREDARRVLESVAAVARPADPAEYLENLAEAGELLRTMGSGSD